MNLSGGEYEIEDKHQVEDISSIPLVQELIKHTVGFERGFIRVNPSGFVYLSKTQHFLNRIKKFEVRDDDIWICTFPKCGTTWTQEMVWCLTNNLDFETSKTVDLDERMIFMEHISIMKGEGFAEFPDTIELAAKQPSPRIIKTHLPFTMLPDQIRTREKTPKLIHVSRNSRDVCVSLYHHWKLLEGFNGGFDMWSRIFFEGYSGYYSPFWKHIESYYQSKYTNMVFLKYEDMKNDLKGAICSVSSFLDCKDYNGDEIKCLTEHLSINNFQNTPTLHKAKLIQFCVKMGSSAPEEGIGFVRKGIVGDWVNYFSDEMSNEFLERDAKLCQCGPD